MGTQPEIRIGTCGWSYPTGKGSWSGIFYPTGRSRLDELAYYSQFFDAVEVNSTFYSPPRPQTAKGWASKTPSNFLFSIKVWQKFTHPKMFEQFTGEKATVSQADFKLFKSGLDPLLESGKLACLLFQFPPSFHNNRTNREVLGTVLNGFPGFQKVVELRHATWTENQKDLPSLLNEVGAGLVVIDEPKFASSIHQEFFSCGEIFYLRLHGRNRAKWWDHSSSAERYDYLYTSKEILSFSLKLKNIIASLLIQKIFIFFNNHPNAQAPANAVMLQRALGLPIRAGLPEGFLSRFPELQRLLSGRP
jgi:uncharacterized protein YecE (DUF72 family)